MKIAFAIERFDWRHGGAEQYTWGLAKWLAGEGHDITVFTTLAEPLDFPAQVRRLDPRPGPPSGRPLRLAAALQSALADASFDVVHGANHVWPCDVLRPGGGVHVAFEHFNALSKPSALRRAVKRLSDPWNPRQRVLRENERRQFDDPARIFIAVSRRVAADMVRCYPHCAGRVRVVHNGVDTRRFHPAALAPRRAAARQAAGLKEGETALLFVSNNFRLKGLHDLIASLPLLVRLAGAPVRLLVAGRGQSGSYARLAARLGVADRVLFLGQDRPVLDLYAAADVLVHPTYYDACANAPLEALACGLPVVVSRTSGVDELLTDGRGARLVSMPCPRDELASAVADAARPEFRAAALETNPELAARHDLVDNHRAVLDIYQAVAAARR